MAKKSPIPTKSTPHMFSPADSKKYNVPRSFSASPKTSHAGVDIAQSVARPNTRGASVHAKGSLKASTQHGGADTSKTFSITPNTRSR